MKYSFTAAADNYEPVPRGYLSGTLLTGMGYDGKSDILVFKGIAKHEYHRAVYILDFGTRVEVRYVVGWSKDGSHIFLQPFPLSEGTRPDNGRPVDMSHWMLGPRRAFHLKLKESEGAEV